MAAGGMGEIYLAHRDPDGPSPEKVAIKVLRREFSEDPQVVRMFLNEARLAGCLAHESIVRVFDVGQAEGRYYLAMEYVDGVSGSALVKALAGRRERLSGELISLIGQKLCAGLQHVHDYRGPDGSLRQLVHRDVNPRNVLVSRRGEVKLTDFGIAKAANVPGNTRRGTVKGTLEYLAPEQVRGKPADARSDVYGAGITLYYLATLDSPFWRGSVGPTLEAIQISPLPSLQILRPDLSPALMRAIERATDKSPHTRFQSAQALAEALPRVSPGAQAHLAAHVRRCELPPIDVRPDFEDLSAPKVPTTPAPEEALLHDLPTQLGPQLVADEDIVEVEDEEPTAASSLPQRMAERRVARVAAVVAMCAAGAVLFTAHAPRTATGCELPMSDTHLRASMPEPCALDEAPSELLRASVAGALCLGGHASVGPLPGAKISCYAKRSKGAPGWRLKHRRPSGSRLAFRR